MKSIPQKRFHVYRLIDDMDTTRPEGVFYIGFGNAKRLRTTILEAGYDSSPAYLSEKAQKIREIWSQGREPRQDIVYSDDSSYKAMKCEKLLIQKYKPYLTNHRGVYSKYPQYDSYAGYNPGDEDENIALTLHMPDPDQLTSAINAAKEINAKIDSDAAKEVTDFLLGLQKQFYPELVEEGPSTELAKIARKALTDDGSYLFTHFVTRKMTKDEQNQWLDELAQKVIELTLRSKKNHGHYPGKKEFRELGYDHIEDTDIFMLVVRLSRAGYIPK